MGLCASMLQRRARRRQNPEPRRGTPTALFVVRGDRRPEPLVFRVQDSGRAQLQKPPRKAAAETGTGRHERRLQQSTDVPDMVNRARMTPRLGAGNAGAAEEPADAPSCTRKTTTAATAWYGTPPPTGPMTPGTPLIVPGTPASAAAMTPGRPVWQRRILMGTRCELPRFSGLVLYDEHGRRVQVATPARRNHRQGKKKKTATAR